MWMHGKQNAMLGPSYRYNKKDEVSLMLQSHKLVEMQPEETDPILGEPLFISTKNGGRYKLAKDEIGSGDI